MNLIKTDLQKKSYKHVRKMMYEIQVFICNIHSLIMAGNFEKRNTDMQPLITKHNPQAIGLGGLFRLYIDAQVDQSLMTEDCSLIAGMSHSKLNQMYLS